MANVVGSRVLDLGLNVLDTEATEIHILAADPADYAAVTSGTLGKKQWTAGGAFASPVAGDTNGRKCMSTAITDGSVTADGTASKWAVVDHTNSRLLANGALSGSQGVSNGNTFTLGSFRVELPDR